MAKNQIIVGADGWQGDCQFRQGQADRYRRVQRLTDDARRRCGET